MIAIIDYGAGNLRSVKNALECLGAECKITGDAAEILNAEKLVLPGDGSFGYLMGVLRQKGLVAPILKSIGQGNPFLGICLGMQALFEESEESPGARGLSIFRGRAARFTKGKIPQTGWNAIIPQGGVIFGEKKTENGSEEKNADYMYFVNSYFVIPWDASIVAAVTDYNGTFASAVQKGNVTGMQFHPEKSGKPGLELLRRWLEC